MHGYKHATVNPSRCTDLYTEQLPTARDTAKFHNLLADLMLNQYLHVSHKLTVRPVYARVTCEKGYRERAVCQHRLAIQGNLDTANKLFESEANQTKQTL